MNANIIDINQDNVWRWALPSERLFITVVSVSDLLAKSVIWHISDPVFLDCADVP